VFSSSLMSCVVFLDIYNIYSVVTRHRGWQKKFHSDKRVTLWHQISRLRSRFKIFFINQAMIIKICDYKKVNLSAFLKLIMTLCIFYKSAAIFDRFSNKESNLQNESEESSRSMLKLTTQVQWLLNSEFTKIMLVILTRVIELFDRRR
jgi:hypothetical protein